MSAADWGQSGPERWAAMTEAIIRAIATVDPTVPGVIVHRALDAHARAATSRSRLAEELRDHPFRLTKDDPRSSAVLARVVADLNAGGDSLVWPRCDGLIWPHLRHAGVMTV